MVHLRDKRTAAAYLNAALDDSDELFLKAIRDVAAAHDLPMSKIAEGANVSRENLYRMLSESGNPRFENLTGVLRVLGLRIAVEADLRPGAPRTS